MNRPSPATLAAASPLADRAFDLAVVIGRMQIPHIGHADLISEAARLAPKVLVVLGSAFQARDPRNPFTWEERAEMMSLAVDGVTKDRLAFAAVPDHFDNRAWVQDVKAAVAQHAAEGSRVVLVGHRKDETSGYIDLFPDFKKREVALLNNVHATDLRNAYFSPRYLLGEREAVDQFMSPGVAGYLLRWSGTPAYAQRAVEHQAVLAYKARWSPNGNEAHFTADAMIVCAGRVLLQQRGGVIGHGLWGLPGGFRNEGEEAMDASLRELGEETGLVLTPEQIEACFVNKKAFGHLLRSPRGHIVTEAFHFDLGDIPLPSVVPAVDQDGHQEAMAVRWVPIPELRAMREQLFEDHGRIITALLRSPMPL